MSTDLAQRLLQFIGDGSGTFEALALEVFHWQQQHNSAYRAFCDRQPPVTQWREIPAVPTAAFKEMVVACFPIEEAAAEFWTSGTSGTRPGRHYLRTLCLYEAAARRNFADHLLPDAVQLPALCLTPSPAAAPRSSLVRMLDWVGGPAAEYFVEGDTLAAERLCQRLGRAQAGGQPLLLLGTAFAFAHLDQYCADRQRRFALPAGSRLMETGGFKGRTRTVTRAELYERLTDRLGIPATHLVNEYGMTELSSQFYDETMRIGRPTDRKRPPPWTRVIIVDPRTGREAAAGQPGLIRVFDLANLWSSMAVQTEDLGIAHPDGTFVVLGRASEAAVRGCSLNAESLRAG